MENIETSVSDVALAPFQYRLLNKLAPAELVSKDDRVFDRVLPLESVPALGQLRELNEDFISCVQVSVQAFVRIGYILNQIRLNNLYRYVKDVGLKGYTSFFKYCEDWYGLSKKTVQRYIDVNVRYCGNGPEFIVKGAERYSFRQLAELSSFQNGLDGKIPPKASVRDIEKLRKYYSSRGWEVSFDTTWEKDLESYVAEQAEEAKYSRERIKKFSFESGPERRSNEREKSITKSSSSVAGKVVERPKNAHKEYDQLLAILDQTVKSLTELRPKSLNLSSDIDEMVSILEDKAKILRVQKSCDLFTGFD